MNEKYLLRFCGVIGFIIGIYGASKGYTLEIFSVVFVMISLMAILAASGLLDRKN